MFFLIKWLGAAYLVWLGVRMVLSRSSVLASGVEISTPPQRTLTPFSYGLVTQGANPKALVFFTAILPQFINPEAAVPSPIAILGVSSILIELLVLAIYVAVCQQARGMVQRPNFALSLNRAAGILLIGAGVGLATMQRA